MEATVLKWMSDMTKGSNFPQNVAITEDQITTLLKAPNMDDILNRVMRHARPANELEHIHLNLNHSSLRKNLVEGKPTSKIVEAHSSLKTSVENAKMEMTSEAEELKLILEEEERLRCEERELEGQLALLNVAMEDAKGKTQKFRQWKDTLDNILPEFPPPSSPQEESIWQEAAKKDLQAALVPLKELKQQQLCKREPSHEDKLEVFRRVESVLDSHSPSAVLRSLASLAARETSSINEVTQQIDLASDAKNLRLKYTSSGEFIEQLSPQGVLESTEAMLVQMSGKHISSHFRNLQKSKETQASGRVLDQLLKDIYSAAKEHYSDDLASEIMLLCHERLKLAGRKSSLTRATSLVHALEERAEVAKEAKEAMLSDYERIHRFDDQVKEAQIELRSLAVGASTSWEQLERERAEIASLVAEITGALVLPTPVLDGAFSKQVQAVMELPFEDLKAFQTEYGPVPSFPLGPSDCPNSDLSHLSSTVPYITNWEHLVEVVRRRKLCLRLKEDLVADEISSLEALNAALSKQSLSSHKVKDLCKKARAHDRSLESKLTPLLQHSEQINQSMELELDHFQTAIKEWWKQPGSSIKGYISCNDHHRAAS